MRSSLDEAEAEEALLIGSCLLCDASKIWIEGVRVVVGECRYPVCECKWEGLSRFADCAEGRHSPTVLNRKGSTVYLGKSSRARNALSVLVSTSPADEPKGAASN